MKTYVIIVTYNGTKWIERCFSSVCGKEDLHIIAIDNDSTDKTPDIIREKFPDVEVIETGTNLGFGAANNIGFRRAIEDSADYVFLLNQDAWVEEDTINELINCHQNNTKYGVLSPVHRTGKGNKLDSAFFNYLQQNGCRELLNHNLTNVKQVVEVEFVNAALWLIHLDVLKKIGGFDPFFYHYGEDVDYTDRAKYWKYKVGVLSGAYGYHDREDRPYSLKRDLQITKAMIQRNLKNINRRFGYNLVYLSYLVTRMSLGCLLKGKVRMLCETLRIFFVQLFCLGNALNSRKASKRKGAFL